ncbi:MAG: serine/threonine protein kinase [Verrucomicrobia bacterium]|nr:serine/threonine protein kinase [Verrucomicrobiota bacterium]
MKENKRCDQCGTPLGDYQPGGHCLRCLLSLGLHKSGQDEGFDKEAGAETPSLAASADAFPGYRIAGRIGEGGCGEVFRAWQERPVRREVAIKVIKPGMDSRIVLTRFEAERQALALMNHPNIARVFDAGTSSGGRPFFVMEFIEGENIVCYCDRQRLAISQRLDLFLQVCEGVRHAHLRGIIHRDLKPSNILVAETDGHPVPKIIDFGIAKALDHRQLGNCTIYTVFDQFIGTPAYMSPEQAGLTDNGADTRSDVYSLGVLLYELLAGRPPFEPARLRHAAVDEIVRIIREEEPPAPSVGVARAGVETLIDTARLRLSTSRQLVNELRGDLDGIVMKALEKSPDRRYDNAQEMAEDIRRHLRSEPITARPPGVLRRFRKFVRRNKGMVASGFLVLLSLTAGLGISLWMGHKEKRARLETETRAYQSAMNLAVRMSQQQDSGYGGIVALLEEWKRRRPDLCGWEWHFLDHLCHEEEAVIRVGKGDLATVAWSPDGGLLATGGHDGAVKIWDAATTKPVASWRGHSASVLRVAWSPDGTCLASAGGDHLILLWNPNDGTHRTLAGHAGAVSAAAWSPDGRWLATGGKDRCVKVWDPSAGVEIRHLSVAAPVTTVCWSPSGDRLFAFGQQAAGSAWAAPDFHEKWSLPTQDFGEIASSACSPDGKVIATGESDGAIHLRDPDTGLRTNSFWDHLDTGLSVGWSPDGRTIAASSRGNGRIVVRDWRGGGKKIRELLGHTGSVYALAWSPDSSRLASAGADGTVRIWGLSARRNRVARSMYYESTAVFLRWSPDGRRLAIGGPRIEAWFFDFDLDGAPVALENGYHAWTRCGDWRPDGKRLVSCGTNGIRMWDPATRQLLWDQKSYGEDFHSTAWKPDGSVIAATGLTGRLILLNPADGSIHRSIPLAEGNHRTLAWSPDGGLLALGSGREVHFHDGNLRRIRSVAGHADEVVSLAWSPDSTRLVSGAKDGTAHIWEAATGRLLHVLAGHGAAVAGLDWSPDGNHIVSGGWDRTIRLWDPATGTEVFSLLHPGGATHNIMAVDWHPDGQRIALTDLEGLTVILDASPGHDSRPPEAVASESRAESVRFFRAWCEVAEAHSANDPDALRRLAWVRATSPYPEIRDAPKALRQAEEANRLTGGTNPGIRNILAAVRAACGDSTQAAAIRKQAAEQANPGASAGKADTPATSEKAAPVGTDRANPPTTGPGAESP